MGELLTSRQKCPKTMSCTRRDAGSLFSQISSPNYKVQVIVASPRGGQRRPSLRHGPKFSKNNLAIRAEPTEPGVASFHRSDSAGKSCRGNPQVLNHEQIENRTDRISSVNTDFRFFRKYKSNAIGDLGNHTFSEPAGAATSLSGAPIQSQIPTAAATREACWETVSSPAKTP